MLTAPNKPTELTISDFLKAFFPDEHEPISLRAFPPHGAKGLPMKLKISRSELAGAELRKKLIAINKTHGIYFVVNAGGDGDIEITGGEEKDTDGREVTIHPPGRFNACFVEADNRTIEEQHTRLDACPLKPSIRIETKKSVHAYWLLKGVNPGDVFENDWREVQRRLIAYFDGDPQIKNPSRVMRVPYFDHISADGSRKRVDLVAIDPSRRYTLAELLDAFPPVEDKKSGKNSKSKRSNTGIFETWDALRAELGRRIANHESAQTNGSGKIDCRGICHNGKGGTGLFYDPSTNQAHCNNGCGEVDILRAFGLPGHPPQEEEWERPTPFNEYELPNFPLDALTDWLRSYVKELATATQTPVDMAAMLGITNCAAAIAGNVVVRIRKDYFEPTNIYSVTVLGVGNRKTAVHEAMKSPLEEVEHQLIREKQAFIEEAKIEQNILESRLDHIKKAAGKAEDVERRRELLEEAKEIAEDLRKVKVPAVPKLIASGDITPEAIASTLAEQDGRLFISSDEGELFEMLAGRYGNGSPNIETILKAHSGSKIRVDRRGRSEVIESATLTIGMTVQPDVLRGLAGKPGFRGRGLIGRFLYIIPKSLVGSRKVTPEPMNEETRARYSRRMKSLAGLCKLEGDDGELRPRVVSLSSEGLDCLISFMEEIEPQLGEGGILYPIADWATKLNGAVVRIAAILHLAENSNILNDISSIPATTVRRAIEIGRYLIPHALAAFAEMGADPQIDNAKYVLRWIQREQNQEFTKRDAHNANGGRFKKVTEIEPALELLEAHGFIRPLVRSAKRGVGRKSSQIYEVNPYLLYIDRIDRIDKLPDPQAKSVNSGNSVNDNESEDSSTRKHHIGLGTALNLPVFNGLQAEQEWEVGEL